MTPSQLHLVKVDGLKSSISEKYQRQKVPKVSNCHILVLSFLFAIGYLGLLQMSDGHFIQVSVDVEFTEPGGQVHVHSLLQCTGRTAIPGLHHTPSTPLLSEVDVFWIGCVLLHGPALWHSVLDFHAPTLLPNFLTSRTWNNVFAVAGAELGRCVSRF